MSVFLQCTMLLAWYYLAQKQAGDVTPAEFEHFSFKPYQIQHCSIEYLQRKFWM